MSKLSHNIGIIGLGLIGGSLAKALKKSDNFNGNITAFARRKESLDQSLEDGAIDFATDDYKELMERSDVVVICSPLNTYLVIGQEINKHIELNRHIITDVGSVQRIPITFLCSRLPENANVVPVHPIAGGELSGYSASHEGLFLGKKAIFAHSHILNPISSAYEVLSTEDATRVVDKMWCCAGILETKSMSALSHDKVYAKVSHFIQLLMTSIGQLIDIEEYLEYDGYKEFLRLAESSLSIWHPIWQHNYDALKDVLEEFRGYINGEMINEQQIAKAVVRLCKNDVEYAGSGYTSVAAGVTLLDSRINIKKRDLFTKMNSVLGNLNIAKAQIWPN